MNMIPEEQMDLFKNSVQKVTHKNQTAALGKAFLIASCAVYTDGVTTWYHYPAFYLVHHSLELILKSYMSNPSKGHQLKPIADKLRSDKTLTFSNDEYNLFIWSDQLNSKKGQLRYEEGDHQQFDWDSFHRLQKLGLRLL